MRGLVASGHPAVSEAACEVLRAGGNAFDAAVAAGLAAAVAEPALTSLGGGGFLLARPAGGAPVLFDFFVDTPGRGGGATGEPHFMPVTVRFPGSDQIFNAGLGSAAVPGNVAGFLHVQRRLGRLPLSEVLAPAVALARDGLEVNPSQAYFLELLHPIMTLRPDGAALYEPEGRPLRPGERFRNPELASFLERLAIEGEAAFYRGEIGACIERDMRQGGGLLTRADLEAYRVIERAPLVQPLRGGGRLLTNPPPSSGGKLLALALELLLSEPPACGGPESPEHLVRLVRVMEEVERRRELDELAAAPLEAGSSRSSPRRRHSRRGTTHVSVWDREGNVASMTTSNGEGSGYLVPGTGIMLNNMLGEEDLHPRGFHASPPGERVASMMSPSLVLAGERVRLVIGSGGSKRIRTALLQVVARVIEYGQDVSDAVPAPRLHWDGSCVQVEPGFPPAVLDALAARWRLNRWKVRDVYFGGVHAVVPGEGAAADPRRGGDARAA